MLLQSVKPVVGYRPNRKWTQPNDTTSTSNPLTHKDVRSQHNMRKTNAKSISTYKIYKI